MEYNKEDLRKLIDTIKELNAKATPGPWSYEKSDGKLSPLGCYEIYETFEDDPPIVECHEWQEKENAHLICLLRSNCDFIIEALEKNIAPLAMKNNNKGYFVLTDVAIIAGIGLILGLMIIPVYLKVRDDGIIRRYQNGEKLTEKELEVVRKREREMNASLKTFKQTDYYDQTPAGSVPFGKIVVNGKEFYLIPYDYSYETVDIKGKRFLTVPVQQ